MARSQAQSDFSVVAAADVVLPASAEPVALPRAQIVTSQAGELATRWVMRATWLMLLALALLCAVGTHIPSGE